MTKVTEIETVSTVNIYYIYVTWTEPFESLKNKFTKQK